MPSGTCPEQESREPGPWQTEGVPSTKISLSSLRQPEPASWCLVAPLCLARAPACQRSAWMTTNMAAPVDRQRLGRRGPLAVGPGNVSWPAEVEGKAALKKAASSWTIWHFFELTHRRSPLSLPCPSGGWAGQDKDRTMQRAEQQFPPSAPFSPGPGSCGEAHASALDPPPSCAR